MLPSWDCLYFCKFSQSRKYCKWHRNHQLRMEREGHRKHNVSAVCDYFKMLALDQQHIDGYIEYNPLSIKRETYLFHKMLQVVLLGLNVYGLLLCQSPTINVPAPQLIRKSWRKKGHLPTKCSQNTEVRTREKEDKLYASKRSGRLQWRV